jgi:polyhydroxyalkanoate synthesis regulator phasin
MRSGELQNMAKFEDIAKKAFYLGVGVASYAQEKANEAAKDLRVQAQKLAEEMIQRGEMNAEEARKFVDDLVEAQPGSVPDAKQSNSREPRKIEIVDEDEAKTQSDRPNNNPDLRQQVQSLQEELRRLRKEM